MTPVEELERYIRKRYETGQVFDNLVENLKRKEKDRMLDSYKAGNKLKQSGIFVKKVEIQNGFENYYSENYTDQNK